MVRLIAAGLRAGGIRTWAKVTGTLPSIIDHNGEDLPIVRGTPSSIIEQRAVIAEAAAAGAEALVVECMALEPAFQRAELSLIRPTMSVITNVRLDHEEVFGSSLLDIALALSNTVSRGGVLATTEGEGADVLRRTATARKSSVIMVDGAEIPDSLIQGFSYIEHKENVGLALAVCRQLGVPEPVALEGMRRCQPDPGALRLGRKTREDKQLLFVSGLAANDPQSTMLLYERVIAQRNLENDLLVLVNTRRDRPLRSLQLGRLLKEIPAARYIVIGNDTEAVVREASRSGVREELLDAPSLRSASEVVDRLFAVAATDAAVFAIGNTAGLGLEVALWFLRTAEDQQA